jgi:hypothetical protein
MKSERQQEIEVSLQADVEIRKLIDMSRMKELNEIAEGVAEVTLELMCDTVDWQLSDYSQDGADYDTICKHVLDLAITKMFDGLRE